MISKCLFPLLAALVLTLPALAQDDDTPRSDPMPLNAVVNENLTDIAFYDWWFIQASVDDTLLIEMRATGDLEPLIGLLDGGGTLIARSADGEAGGSVTLEHTVPTTGEYVVVATRVGNRDGTSIGEYELSVRLAGSGSRPVDLYQQVEFRCGDMQVTIAATLIFAEDRDLFTFYRISVYGLDTFVPVLRVYAEGLDVPDCARDSQAMDGDTLALPGLDIGPVTVTGDLLEQAAQLTISGTVYPGQVTVTIGALDGLPGRFVAIVQGMTIFPANDRDTLRIGQGPLAARRPLLLYMVSDKSSRLDPALDLPRDIDPARALACNDAGGRRCEDMPSANGLRLTLTNGDAEIVGGRFDAGLLLEAGEPVVIPLTLRSFMDATSGPYTLVLTGELPARD